MNIFIQNYKKNHADKLEFESLVYSTLAWTEEKHMSLQYFMLRIDFIIKH